MQFIQQEDVKFKGDITKAVKKLMTEKKKLSPLNIARASGYPFKEIEINLFEVGQICEELEENWGDDNI